MPEKKSIDNKYFEILELTPEASLYEIKCAYLHLKKLYSSASPVLFALGRDIPQEKRDRLLKQIDEAYKKLKEFYLSEKIEKEERTRYRVMQKSIPEFEIFGGNALKLTREVLGLELNEIALATGVAMEHLKNIEQERFDLLPPGGYLRIYVTKYAEYLSLDAKRVLKDYMKAFNNKQKGKDNPHRF